MSTEQHHSGIELTSNAFQKVKELIADVNQNHTALRVYVQGGGCAGFEYGFQFDQNISVDDWLSVYHMTEDQVHFNGDWVFEQKDPVEIKTGPDFPKSKHIYVVVDRFSFPLVDGAVLNYVDQDASGRRFIFKNPRARRTCGCGSSFST